MGSVCCRCYIAVMLRPSRRQIHLAASAARMEWPKHGAMRGTGYAERIDVALVVLETGGSMSVVSVRS
jgi:hypothetical protein